MNYLSHRFLDNEKVEITVHIPHDPEEIYTLECSKEMWEANLVSIGHAEPPYWVGGWVQFGQQFDSSFEFVEMSLIPISDHGVYIESSYERELYNYLHQNQRLVQKIFDATMYSSWNGFLPDGLLIDTKPSTVLEVFGMSENNETYHQRKQQKIDHFTQLKRHGKYGFWYWQASL